ncbi:OTU deubiquitinase with linear linkage specificity a [Gouania willdenowi]|nr:protein YAE1 homolog [Gouania willdenowi]
MSWLNASVLSSDDVFDETADELSLMDKEWTNNMKKRVLDGYVDGADAGEDASLQEGFNQGFIEGAARTAAVGTLKGTVCAIQSWYQIQHPGTPVPASVTELLQLITQHEHQVLDSINKDLENPPQTVSDISESMEDLEVKGCSESDCCKRAENMDMDSPSQPHTNCPESVKTTFSLSQSLNHLVQRCMDIVTELGLPHEIKDDLEKLKTQ